MTPDEPGAELIVTRGVVRDMVRLAAEEVPGVLRLGHGGPRWRGALLGAPVKVRLHGRRADIRVVLIARPAHSVVAVANQVRDAVESACQRLLGLEGATVSVLVDGVGG